MGLGKKSLHRKAFATWCPAQSPSGSVSTESAALRDAPYEVGTGGKDIIEPTGLIAAAQAACFSATLAAELSRVGMQAETIKTTAVISSGQSAEGWAVSGILLDVVAVIPGAKPGDFISAAYNAKLFCPICRLLNVNVTMNARLEERV
jgi:OsmC subfamily peroxiredoxin